MDESLLKEIQDKIKKLIGPTGCYVLMVTDAKDTRAWVDGDSRLKMRGLLEYGYDILRDGLNGQSQPLPLDRN